MKELLTAFRDNCGFGMIAHIQHQPSRQMTLDAVEALSRMMHRGAVAADRISGDGSGLLFSMPDAFMRRMGEMNGFDLPERYAVAMIFATQESQLQVFSEYAERNDLRVLFFRHVPVNKEVLGRQALETLPLIVQAFVIPNAPMSAKRFPALLYLTRKEVEHHLAADPDFYIPSFSESVISYKGLVMPTTIQEFYLDLQEEDFAVSFALFHQRFSTNTLPRWKLAQPFRTLAHNGEINSIQANRFNMSIREECLESGVFTKEELARIFPILSTGSSDSASLDNVFEFLLVNGMDFFESIRMLVPAPWQNMPQMDPRLRAFYEYMSCKFEAWDGPAALNVTDGRYVGCILDRNGLRPAKYMLTTDHRLIIASEYGVVDLLDEQILEQGKLQSGQMIAVDLKYGQVFKHEDINEYLMTRRPWAKWLNENSSYLMEHIDQNFFQTGDYQYDNLVQMQRYHNYTNEVVEGLIAPMADKGKEETGSMGDDTPMACFSKVQRNFTDFFRQKFAQVTNPPIDPLREKVVMSTTVNFGRWGNVLINEGSVAKRLKAITPILSYERLQVLLRYGTKGEDLYDEEYRARIFYTGYERDLRASLNALGEQVVCMVEQEDVKILIFDDRVLTAGVRPMPMPMVVGYVNTLLAERRMRSKVSILVCTGEVYDAHSAAVMLAYGASAIYPYLLFATALQWAERKGANTKAKRKKALANVQEALVSGLLKILSKMGICTIESYKNSALFDLMGLSEEVARECFRGSYALLPGLGYDDIDFRLSKYHREAYRHQYVRKLYPLEVGSFYKYAEGGEYHDFNPEVAKLVRKVAQRGGEEAYQQLSAKINGRGLRMVRDFLQLREGRTSIPLQEVEPVQAITRRFTSAAMSLGSISPEAHEAIAEAMNTLGGQSNSGEGGEDARRFGTRLNSKIKQVASGRFGVTPHYLRNAEEIQIKVAQGAKPGEGGQLPGSKVTPLIATLRCTTPGVTLISPPPHHDIYSIEDLAQLIFDLKQVNPQARISVKLVSTAGVGTIAVGVAKAYADKIIISGCDGGTGAAQLSSIKFAGNPWEVGLAEAHNALKANHMRHLVQLQTDGGLKTGLDVLKATILGAESYAFGTSLLATVGCKILRVCHLNKCSVGVATQDEMLRAYYTGTVQGIVQYLTSIAEEVRVLLASLGYRSLQEVVGQTHLLEVVNDEFAKKFDFSFLLHQEPGVETCQQTANPPLDENLFEQGVVEELRPVIERPVRKMLVERDIRNTNRSFGARLSGEIVALHGPAGLPKETVTINLRGTAGQSLGAFLTHGILMNVEGAANDYVGKGMSGGRIVIRPSDPSLTGRNLAGNTCLYGATGGKLFVAGTVGERFGVRNSGALAVVEGTGDHPCEYMTGGTVVILGETGVNFGAGMTGGVAFVYDKNRSFIDKMNHELIKAERIDTDEADEARYYLMRILRSFLRRTQSPKAQHILDNFRNEIGNFYMVTSKEMKAPLNPFEGN